jgi:Cu+-exporting ATPase
MKEVELKIGGMHCAGCAAGIEKSLVRLKGISQAHVNFALGTAHIDYEPEAVEEKSILDKIVELGYSPEKLDGRIDTAGEEIKSRRRDLLIAAVLTILIVAISLYEMLSSKPLIQLKIKAIVLFLLALPVLLFAGKEIFSDAWNQTRHFRANMNSLIAIGSSAAFIYSSCLMVRLWFSGGQGSPHFYFETSSMIITLILLGRYLETRAKGRAKDAIESLLKLRPEKATAIINGDAVEVDVASLVPGMTVLVRPGERIPADGKIVEGTALVDESMLTGESLPVDKQAGDEVIGGSISKSSSFRFEVTGTGENTFLAGVIKLVNQAQNRKAPIQRLADRVAGIFTPVVLLAGILTFAIWYLVDPHAEMLLKAPIAVLIIACPCALGLATPLAILAGTGRAARRGIFIRGGDVLENSVKTDHIVFDKTGTLTEGRFEMVGLKSFQEGKEDELLLLAASGESGSQHPLAAAIREKARRANLTLRQPKNLVEFPGFGLKAEINEKAVILGNEATMEKEKIDISALESFAEEEMARGRTVVYVAADGHALGFLVLADRIKDEAPSVINEIKKGGRHVIMLTGDNYKTAKGVASYLGIEKFEARVKPDQKAAIIETLRRADKHIMMVGDGINDAPALALADVGVALGSGTDVAMESADIILVHSNLNTLVEALEVSRLTFKTIKQNLFWAFFYNLAAIPLAAGILYPVFGWGLSPAVAAGAMAFSSLFVVTNSLRLLQTR